MGGHREVLLTNKTRKNEKCFFFFFFFVTMGAFDWAFHASRFIERKKFSLKIVLTKKF